MVAAVANARPEAKFPLPLMAKPPFPVRVETEEDRGRKSRFQIKGRSFGARLIACQVAQGYWENSSRDPLRPTFALFATTVQEERPFLANLRDGRRLRVEGVGFGSRQGWPMEFLKSAGYTFDVQRVKAGALIEVTLRELFEYRPGMVDPEDVRFCMSLPEGRLLAEEATLEHHGIDRVIRSFKFEQKRHHGAPYDARYVVAEGWRFAASLNERATEIPIVQDTRFTTRLLLSAVRHGFAKRNERVDMDFSPDDRDGTFFEVGMDLAKRAPGLVFRMKQGDMAEWIGEELRAYERGR